MFYNARVVSGITGYNRDSCMNRRKGIMRLVVKDLEFLTKKSCGELDVLIRSSLSTRHLSLHLKLTATLCLVNIRLLTRQYRMKQLKR